MKLLIETVKEWAKAHYNEGGWDVIVECWGDAEIQEHLERCAAQTQAKAIKAFEPVVAVWAERQADAINSAF